MKRPPPGWDDFEAKLRALPPWKRSAVMRGMWLALLSKVADRVSEQAADLCEAIREKREELEVVDAKLAKLNEWGVAFGRLYVEAKQEEERLEAIKERWIEESCERQINGGGPLPIPSELLYDPESKNRK